MSFIYIIDAFFFFCTYLGGNLNLARASKSYTFVEEEYYRFFRAIVSFFV